MNLIDLVSYFRGSGDIDEFYKEHLLNSESEVVEVFTVKPFSVEARLRFLEIEKTGGSVKFILDGIEYYNLFDFYYFLDAIEESDNEDFNKLTDREIAEKLLSYAIKDA